MLFFKKLPCLDIQREVLGKLHYGRGRRDELKAGR